MSQSRDSSVPPTLRHGFAIRFWVATILTGIATGIGAIWFTWLLEAVQRLAWGGSGGGLLESVQRVPSWRVAIVLLLAGVVTGAGQVILRRLTSANGIDTATAIWFHAGRLPAVRTLGECGSVRHCGRDGGFARP